MGVNVGLVARGGRVGGEVMVILGGKGGFYCSYGVWGGEGGGGFTATCKQNQLTVFVSDKGRKIMGFWRRGHEL